MRVKTTREFQLQGLTGIKFQAGNEMEVSEEMGRKWIRADVAVEVIPMQVEVGKAKNETETAETATITPAENTMLKPPLVKKSVVRKK